MQAPLSGVTVVEVANWLAAPAAGALMCDLGADVIKVEPPGGDVYRHYILGSQGYDYDFKLNHAFELDNRGKRSLTVTLDRPGGPALVRRLCRQADVFLTNLLPARRERFQLTEAAIRTMNPLIVYASLSGYGTQGQDADRPGFDHAAFWARSGIMGTLGAPASPPELPRPGQGDHATSLNLLAGILAALRLRDQTQIGQYVEVTLQGTGMWTIASDLAAALVAKQQPRRHDREEPANPIWNSYQTRDTRWLLLVMPRPDPYWAPFCHTIGEPQWASDPRYDSLLKRREASRELTAGIARRFSQFDRDYWAEKLDENGMIWAPVAELPEVVADRQPREMHAFTTIDHPRVGEFETLSAPFAIRDADIAVRGPAPEPGEHTAEILAEAGLSDSEIADLAVDGVLG